MGLFGSKEERAKKRDYSKEKRARYKGINMQPIGQIPDAVEVVLSLTPEQEVLNIAYKAINITLPYSRIIGFSYNIETTDKTHSILKNAQTYLGNAEATPAGFDPLGAKKLVAGLTGNVASSLIPRKTDVRTVSTLKYTDKNGVQQQLQFYNSYETGYMVNTNDIEEEYQDEGAVHFSEVIKAITSRQAESITEL